MSRVGGVGSSNCVVCLPTKVKKHKALLQFLSRCLTLRCMHRHMTLAVTDVYVVI